MNKSKLLTLIKYFVSIDFFAILSIKQNLKTKGKKAASFQGIAGILVFIVLFIYGAPKVGEFIARNFHYFYHWQQHLCLLKKIMKQKYYYHYLFQVVTSS